MSNITLRSLHPDDLNRVSEIESSVTGRARRAFLEKRLAAATAMPDSFITCAALDGDKIAGYGYARILHGEFGVKSQIGELLTIGVDPDYQRKGIGKAVLAGIEQRMAKRNVSTLETQADWSDGSMMNFFSSTGFLLATGQIMERDTSPLSEEVAEVAPVRMDGKWQVHRESGGDHRDALTRHHTVVRSLRESDLETVVRIDTKLTGLNRLAYYFANFREMLDDSGIRISLVAEDGAIVTGFVMARVDYGDFGQVEKAAVIDAIGVHPAYAGSGVGHELLTQLLANLATLKVESVRTKVEHANFGLRSFLHGRGFDLSQRLLLTKQMLPTSG